MHSNDVPELGTHMKNANLDNLLSTLSYIYSEKNILAISRETSRLLNYLTPFSHLKEAGKIRGSIWLDEAPSAEDFASLIENYNSIIVIITNDETGLQHLKQFWTLVQHRRQLKINLVVKDLSRSFYYQLLSEVFLESNDNLLTKCIDTELKSHVIRISATCRLLSWTTYPVLMEDFVLSTNMSYGGLTSYFRNPVELVSDLSEALVQIIKSSVTRKDTIKLKNVYAKGDHSGLFCKIFLNERLPEYFSSEFTANEQDFYINKLSGNTDLVILERNLDYFPLLLSNMSYAGILDDLFGIEDELNNTLSTKEKLDDEFFQNVKHLNFAAIGVKLNKLARFIQQEFDNKDKLNDLQEMRELVNKLGSLTTKQEVVRKHTALSESVLDFIKTDLNGESKYNMREKWLGIQNEIFDLDYKQQLKGLHGLISDCSSSQIILSMITLISLTNDGIRQKDLDDIEISVLTNFGLQTSLALRSLLNLKIIRVNTKGNDFFATFTFGKSEIETTTTSTASASARLEDAEEKGYDDFVAVGVNGGQDVYKSTYTLISKFWNLHPVDEEEPENLYIDSVNDYPNPSFALPSSTVPLLPRIVESLYFRDFLKYKPVNNISRRPNWNNLNLDTMFKGQTIDRNLCDTSEKRNLLKNASTRQEYLIVVLLGGITRSEISVFKYLQGRLKNKKIYVLTTGIVNNKKFLQAMD